MRDPETLHPGFLDVPLQDRAWDTARFVVLPLPYDATCSYGVGTRFGPARILEASHQVEWYDEETGTEPGLEGVCTLRPVDPVLSSPDAYHDAVLEAARPALAEGKVLIGIGGDHSVSWGPIRAARERYPDLAVVQIDAHLDLRDQYQGSQASHACILRRVVDGGIPTVQVGIRSGTREEWALVRERGLPVFRARDIVGAPPESWIPRVLAAIPSRHVYLTMDVDGFDPSVFPGTGTPEPGGLSWYQGLALVRALTEAHKVVAFDCVEVEPVPGSHVSEFAAAKLIYRVMAGCLG